MTSSGDNHHFMKDGNLCIHSQLFDIGTDLAFAAALIEVPHAIWFWFCVVSFSGHVCLFGHACMHALHASLVSSVSACVLSPLQKSMWSLLIASGVHSFVYVSVNAFVVHRFMRLFVVKGAWFERVHASGALALVLVLSTLGPRMFGVLDSGLMGFDVLSLRIEGPPVVFAFGFVYITCVL